MSHVYALDIEWEKANLPDLVGPFPKRTDAEEWAALNIPNERWVVRKLTWPHSKGGVRF